MVSNFSSGQEILFLDIHEDPNTGIGFTTPVFSASPQLAGKSYKITLERAFSLASPADWAIPTPCGALEPSATFPSTGGVMDGPVGMDPLYFFAVPNAFCGFPLPLLVPSTTLNLDNDGSFGLPLIGSPLPYNPAHLYSFSVTGQGMNAAFRYRDLPTSNNYGQTRITIEFVNEFQLCLNECWLSSYSLHYR